MLDHGKKDNGYLQVDEFEWLKLSNVERSLIKVYRQLSEQDRRQLRRVTETLASNPEEQVVTG